MNDVLAFLTGLVAAIIPGFGQPATPHYNGYVEADYVYPAAPSGGVIATIGVAEGQHIDAGALLVALATAQQQAALDGARARVTAAEANLTNLLTGSRSDEIDVIRASLDKAEADLGLAADSATRSQKLFAEGLIPQAQLDQDQAQLKSATAAVQQLQAQLKVAELPARDAQQVAAEANLAAARADAAQAEASLADRMVKAPVGGAVDTLYYHPGEVAAAGAPLLSLLPDGGLKVKFYLPEADRQGFALGDRVAVGCDGCAEGLTATISYFAATPEFTPPVIYSRDERNRMTFLTEATLDTAGALRPGQPVTLERVR